MKTRVAQSQIQVVRIIKTGIFLTAVNLLSIHTNYLANANYEMRKSLLGARVYQFVGVQNYRSTVHLLVNTASASTVPPIREALAKSGALSDRKTRAVDRVLKCFVGSR